MTAATTPETSCEGIVGSRLRPSGVSFSQAAAFGVAYLTAYVALVRRGAAQPWEWLLVHGAAGGVGTFAVQLARWRGARVVATASARDLDFVRDLGADEVIDYRATPFEAVVRDVDVVLDSVGGAVTERSWSVLRPGGLLVTIVRQPPDWATGHAARGSFILVGPSRAQLNELSRLLDAGVIRPVVEAVLPLRRAREAYERGIGGHPRGKLVLQVAGDEAMRIEDV